MKFKQIVIAAAVLLAASQSGALTVAVTNDVSSQVAGAVTVDFDAATPAQWSATGGALFSASVGGITARPPGSTGNFWSIGTSGDQDGPGVVTIAGGASYYGFLYGSPDGYNSVEFFSGESSLGSFSGDDLIPPAFGDQQVGRYINVMADEGQWITTVRFTSGANAFESDNHAYLAAPVPEPQTYALMLAGLAAVGFVTRRRAPPR